MERPGFAYDTTLPGYDVLQDSFHERLDIPVDVDAVEPFLSSESHRTYLENNAFHRYLKMHKVTTGISGAKELQVLGRELEGSYMPTHTDAAAWAYAEAGLTDTSLSAVDRVDLVTKAEALWERALKTDIHLQSSEYGVFFDEPSAAYRYALPLAFTPLMKSVVIGNVTTPVLQRTLADTVAFSSAVSDEIRRYDEADNVNAKNMFIGLLHEINALSTLLYMEDPRYIPMPSTARADTGYYHPSQTHDIMVLNQHWGTIRKVIPIEIKAKASSRDRRRYRSLIIRGKMHLGTNGADPTETAASFERLLDGAPEPHDAVGIERIATEVRELLRLYQQGVTPEALAMRSLTRFHKSPSLERAHPEIAP